MMQLISVDSATHTAISGMLELSITANIDDGNGVISSIPYGWSQSINDPAPMYQLISAWLAAHPDFPIGAYVPPIAPPAPTSPYLYATAQILVANADVASMSISSQLSGAFRFDVGQYWIFFTDEQPDTQYMALAYDSGAVRTFVREADKFTGYFIVSVTDFSSVPTDPDAINLEIKRVQ